MSQVASLAINGVSDTPPPPKIFQAPTMPDSTISSFPTDGGDTSGILGTVFTGWKLYNDTVAAGKASAAPVATPDNVAKAQGPNLNYLLLGGAALVATLLILKR